MISNPLSYGNLSRLGILNGRFPIVWGSLRVIGALVSTGDANLSLRLSLGRLKEYSDMRELRTPNHITKKNNPVPKKYTSTNNLLRRPILGPKDTI